MIWTCEFDGTPVFGFRCLCGSCPVYEECPNPEVHNTLFQLHGDDALWHSDWLASDWNPAGGNNKGFSPHERSYV